MSEVQKKFTFFKAYVGAPNSKGIAEFDPKSEFWNTLRDSDDFMVTLILLCHDVQGDRCGDVIVILLLPK